MNYSQDELLICMLARQLRDHEVIAVGNNSPVPAAAALLAKLLHAKHATVYILGQPDWPFDGTKEFFDLMQRGGIDVFFLSGAQIDSYGNINLHVIGHYDLPKVRLPGGAGAGVVYFMCKRILLFKTDHGVKGFPEKLDFVTAVSASESNVYRNSRLEGVFTPLGVMKPLGPGNRLILAETAPGVPASDVQARTGFDLGTVDQVQESKPPTAQELELLRNVASAELGRIYPVFAEQAFGEYITTN